MNAPTIAQALSHLLPPRIVDRLLVSAEDCWEWQGALANGYGRVRWNDQSALVHRVVYVAVHGQPTLPDLDHLCRNRKCANPAHLEPVTHAENIRRGEWSAGSARLQTAKTHCPNNHPLSGANLYVPPLTSRKQRICRTCRLEAKRRYNAKRRAS
jgi:hypothetical protein